MNLIKTKSFELALTIKGELSASKLALVLPGRLDTKDYANIQSHVTHLASLGYLAISFDPPGTWESPGGIELFTMTNYIKAVEELIEHYKKPTFIFGHSRGGTVGMIVGLRNKAVTSFAAAMSSPAKPEYAPGWKEAGVKDSYRDLPPGTEKTKEQKHFRILYKYFEDAIQYDARDDLRKSTKAKLFFTGNQDSPEWNADINKAYAATSEPKEMHGLDSVHDYRYNKKAIDTINQTMTAFLKKYG